jgi:hypothetical protein
MKALLALLVVAALGGVSYAYPQYLSRDATCTGCHISPDGGGMLNENGLSVAEATAWKDGSSEFMYGMSLPGWLQLDGHVRAAAGYVQPGVPSAAAYPMQAELGARAAFGSFSINAVGGLRRPQEDGSVAHVLWSREHYLMWQQKPGENTGLYVRAGRLMPTFGLRLAEHVVYTQRFGGRPLYGEAYALAASYIDPKFEVHASGFVHDSITAAVEKGDGGALYAEARLGEHAAVGVEGKYSKGDDVTALYGGLTGKLYLPGPALLLLAEGQVVRKEITAGAGDKATQLVAYAMGSRELGSGFLLDIGVGHFTQDTRVKGLYRDCVDANLHWFMTSHIEWLLTTRLELLDAASGPTGAYALAQIHYRM